jgi:transcriptional regulator with XRE-family HTH domain
MRMLIKNIERSPLAEAIFVLRKSLGKTQSVMSKELGVLQSTVAQWERGIYKPPANVLLKLAELAPVSEREWWRDQASKRVGFDLEKPESITAPTGWKEGKALDPELLACVLEAVEAAANKAGIILPRLKYAEILARVYDSWREKGQHDSTIVEKLVNRVCSPSNRKVRTR